MAAGARLRGARAALVIAGVAFFGLGVVLASIGPVLPSLAHNAHSSLTGIGAVFTFFFLGSFSTHLLAGPLNDRLGTRSTVVGGLIFVVVGIVVMALSGDLALTLGAGLVFGLGVGAVDVSLNMLIADLTGEKSVAALNLLNVFYGLGAVSGPTMAGLALGIWGTGLPAFWVGGAVLALQVALMSRLKIPAPPLHEPAGGPLPPDAGILAVPAVWLLGGMMLLYAGLETGVGGWIATYIGRTTLLGAEGGAIVSSGYWLAFTCGRMVGAATGMRFSPGAVLLAALSGALTSALLLVLSTGNATLTILSLLMAGFSYGPVFPTIFAVTMSSFGRGRARAAAVVATMGSVGGMLFPWLLGILITQVAPRAGMAMVAGCALGTLALYLAFLALTGQGRRSSVRPPTSGPPDREIEVAGVAVGERTSE